MPTRGKLERSFRILETTSRHGTTGRGSRPVDSVLWTLEWALWSARQITRCYHTPHCPISSPNIKAHVRFHAYSIDYSNMTIRIQEGMNNCRRNQCRSQKYCKAANGIHILSLSVRPLSLRQWTHPFFTFSVPSSTFPGPHVLVRIATRHHHRYGHKPFLGL